MILGFVIGALYAVMMPPMQIPDEMSHFVRTYWVSRGHCIASPDIDMPKSFADLGELFPPWLEEGRKISTGELQLALEDPLNEQQMAGGARERSLEGYINQNGYHCAPYVPAAIVLDAGRHAAVSPLALMYLCRFTNLFFYVLVAYLALRLLPDFRIVLFCLALMPMSLHQAASCSADATVIAVSFLFAAYVFRIAFGPRHEKVGIRQLAILVAMITFLVLSKSLLCMVLLLLLIPGDRFSSPRFRWLAVGACFLLASGAAVIWQGVNLPNMQRKMEEAMTHQIDLAANTYFLRRHPVETAIIFARCLTRQSFLFASLTGFVGILGSLVLPLPGWLVFAYVLLLGFAAATQTRGTASALTTRGILLLFFAGGAASLLAAGWIAGIPKPVLDEPSTLSHILIPVQGRYWIPFAFPALLAMAGGKFRFSPRYFMLVALAMILVANAIALGMVRVAFYS